MAVSITQQPTTPNAAYTSLLYVVSGSVTTSNPQYSYVMDIYESGSATRLNRVTQVPNPDGVATFNPSMFFQNQLEYDNFWKITGSIEEVNSVKTFDIKFGEQYGTSISSSITVYPDLVSSSLEVFPAVIDPNNGSSYNFNTSSFVGTGNTYLTNFPGAQTTTDVTNPNGYAFVVDSEDYMTLTSFQESSGSSGVIDVKGYTFQDGIASTLIDKVTLSGSNASNFVTFGIGPKNLCEIDFSFSSSIADGAINLLETEGDNGGVSILIQNSWDGSSGTTSRYNYTKTIKPPCNEYIRFAFINKLGFYEYYNVYSPLKRNSSLNRNTVTLPKVDYSSLTSIYSVKNGGETSYYTNINDNYTITTQWLDQDIANWLEELLESPEVFVQQGDEFVPVVITNNTYVSNQSTSRNKLFQYTIEFKPSNGREITATDSRAINYDVNCLFSLALTQDCTFNLQLKYA